MCSPGFLSFLLVISFSLIWTCLCHEFDVGGIDRWVLKPSENYNHWAGRNRFQVNDSLVFMYKKGEDSVLEVNKEDHQKCNTKNPIKSFYDGYSVFKLDRSGPFFFISGKQENCKKGQKLIVVVLAVRDRTISSPPPIISIPPSGSPGRKTIPAPSPRSPSASASPPIPISPSGSSGSETVPAPSPRSPSASASPPISIPPSGSSGRETVPAPSPRNPSASSSPSPSISIPPSGSSGRKTVPAPSPRSPSASASASPPFYIPPSGSSGRETVPAPSPRSPSDSVSASPSRGVPLAVAIFVVFGFVVAPF